MTQHIGIAACSAEGAALCYRTICTEAPELLGAPHAHPEVSMHTPSLGHTMNLIYRRVGLTGTRWLMEGPVYARDLVRPDSAAREEINRIIMDELVVGVFKPAAVGYFQNVMEKMKREGCEAVVLGCTEIPLIMSDANSPLPTLDSTRLLARAALRRAVSR